MSTNDANQGTGIPDAVDKELLNIFMAEYDSLRSEQLARISNQQQAFQFLVAVLAAGVATVVSLINVTGFDLERLPQYALLLPVVAAPLTFIFLDNEIMIFGTGAFISGHLKKCIRSVVKNKSILLSDGRRFTYTNLLALVTHPWISIGRWLLFVLPVVGPVAYAVADREKWPAYQSWASLLLIIDMLLVVLTFIGLVAAVAVRLNWVKSEWDNFWDFRKHRNESCRPED